MTGKEVDIDEVFSSVKINGDAAVDEVDYDDSGCSDGVIYNGLIENPDGGIAPYALNDTASKDYAFSHTFIDAKIGSDNAKASVNGSLALNITASLSYQLFDSNSYVELKLDYAGSATLKISGSAAGTLSIGKFSYSIAEVIILSLQPQITLSANANLETSGKISGSVGFYCSKAEGMSNRTTTPKMEFELKGDFSLYVGINFLPEIDLGTGGWLAQLTMDATVGSTISGSFCATTNATPTEFVVCMEQTDLQDAKLTVARKEYNGAEQFADPVFTNGMQTLTQDMVRNIPDCVYSGGAAEPEITVQKGANQILEKGRDYTVSYENNTGIGTAEAVITGIGNYAGSVRAEYEIKEQFDFEKVSVEIPDLTYQGEELAVKPIVRDGTKILTEGTDYEITGTARATDTGDYQITLKGIGAYQGTAAGAYKILPADLKDVTVMPFPEREYNGRAYQPKPVVIYHGVALQQDTDYTVEYQDNTNAGVGAVILRGQGNFTGERVDTFSITAASLAADMADPILAQRFTGEAVCPNVTIKDGTKILQQGKDYTVSYQDNTQAGTASVTVNGMGNYTGEARIEFLILESADIGLQEVAVPEMQYNGSLQKVCPTVTADGVTLREGTDYELSGDYIAKDAGHYTFTIRGIGAYTGELAAQYEIQKVQMKDAAIAAIPDWTYTDGAAEPEPVVTYGTLSLEKGKDYTVEYRSNHGIGTGIVILTGLGNYTGQQIGLFLIVGSGTGGQDSEIKPSETKTPETENLGTENSETETSGSEAELPKKGTELKKGKDIYTVTKEGATVEFKKTSSTAATVQIPSVVKINGVTYKVTSIASGAFKNKKKLKNVTIGNNVTAIGSSAFRDCKKLKTVIIGKNVQKIGKCAFYGCSKLTLITIQTSRLKTVGSKAFSGISKKAKIKAPAKKKEAYRKLLKKKSVSDTVQFLSG